VHAFLQHREREIPWWACFNDKCVEHFRQKDRNRVYPEVPRIVAINTQGRSYTEDRYNYAESTRHPNYRKMRGARMHENVLKYEICNGNQELNYLRKTKKPRRVYCQMVQERKGPMIQLKVIFQGEPLTALVDSGSSENFISERLVQEIGAEVISRGNMTIERFDGTEANYRFRTTTLKYRISKGEFKDEFRVIPMGTGCEVILGIPWLERNNPKINWQKRTVTLKEARIREEKKTEGNSLAQQGAVMQPTQEAVSGHSDQSKQNQPEGPQRKNNHTTETSKFEYEVPLEEYETRLAEVRKILPEHYQEFEEVFCPRQ
jgi:Retroviral aspartyl protease